MSKISVVRLKFPSPDYKLDIYHSHIYPHFLHLHGMIHFLGNYKCQVSGWWSGT